jgi:hypothetical protein
MRTAFFTGMGRSGTKLLTSLLNCAPEVDCRHEFTGNREFWTLSYYMNPEVYTIPRLEQEKIRILNSAKSDLFIDVNGYLHHCTPQLYEIFNPTIIFHLVRDPRFVIPSIYTRRNEKDIHIIPKSKPEVERWFAEDKFYQVCWNWNEATSKLLALNWPLVQLEQILTDYSYFKEKILIPLGISVSRNEWEKTCRKKVNRTMPAFYRRLYSFLKSKPYVEDSIPAFSSWSNRQKQVFYDVCGDTMKQCGYPSSL